MFAVSLCSTCDSNNIQNLACGLSCLSHKYVPFGVTYAKNWNNTEKGFFLFAEDFTLFPGVVSPLWKISLLDLLIF
jgi:hypothetical protein